MNGFLGAIDWFKRLTIRFVKGASFETVFVVILTSISQILVMLATLLPLKVVMLLASPDIPNFFPVVLAKYDREVLILVLGVVALLCFGINLVVIRVTKILSWKGADKLQREAAKITLFEEQNELAFNAYSKYTRGVASFTFSCIALFALYYLYADIGILLTIYIIFCSIGLLLITEIKPRLQIIIKEKLPSIIGSLNDVGFLLVFIYIIMDFLYLSPPTFFLGIFSMIMTRRLLSLIGMTLNQILFISGHKEKIDALFFHNKVFFSVKKDRQENLWNIVDSSTQKEWIYEVVKEAAGEKPNLIKVKWLQKGIKTAVILKASFDDKRFLIKLFSRGVTHTAQHEASLLLDFPDKLLSPQLLLATSVQGFHCHVFDITDYNYPGSTKSAKETKRQFQQQCLGFKPPAELVQKYRRSKRTLSQRLDNTLFERLKIVASRTQMPIITQVERTLPELIKLIKSVPLSIITPVYNDLILIDANGKIGMPHWCDWTLEPSGFGWQVDKQSLDQMGEAIIIASSLRPNLSKFAFECYVLVALVAELEKMFKQTRYYDAINLLKTIKDVLDTCLSVDRSVCSQTIVQA